MSNSAFEAMNADGFTYPDWMRRTDNILIVACGLDSRCMADFPSWDLWNDSVLPQEAAEVCLVEWNDFPSDLMD